MALTDNLFAFYKLSDLTDSSGNNRTLTNNGNVSFSSGKIGNAAVFDGSDSRNLSLPFNFSGNNAITTSTWVKTSVNGSLGGNYLSILGAWDGEGNQFLILMREDGSLDFYTHTNDSMTNTQGTFNINDDLWHNVVASYDGSLIKLYVDGSLVSFASQTGSIQTNNASLRIGSTDNFSNYTLPFNGQIDAVGIWNRALSEQEVAALYNSGNGLELDGGNGGGGGGNPTLVKMEAPIKFFGKVKFGV